MYRLRISDGGVGAEAGLPGCEASTSKCVYKMRIQPKMMVESDHRPMSLR